MRKGLWKRALEIMKKEMENFLAHRDSVMEVTRIGARMMLQIAIEELRAYLGRDLYERKGNDNKRYKSGYKPRTIKISSGDVIIDMRQVRNAPFNSKLFTPYTTRMKEVEHIITYLYICVAYP